MYTEELEPLSIVVSSPLGNIPSHPAIRTFKQRGRWFESNTAHQISQGASRSYKQLLLSGGDCILTLGFALIACAGFGTLAFAGKSPAALDSTRFACSAYECPTTRSSIGLLI
jgi:hypothetical protein